MLNRFTKNKYISSYIRPGCLLNCLCTWWSSGVGIEGVRRAKAPPTLLQEGPDPPTCCRGFVPKLSSESLLHSLLARINTWLLFWLLTPSILTLFLLHCEDKISRNKMSILNIKEIVIYKSRLQIVIEIGCLYNNNIIYDFFTYDLSLTLN